MKADGRLNATLDSRIRNRALGLCAWLLLVPALAAQAQFTLTTNNNSITVSVYTGTNTSVVVPGTTNGFKVTSIADNTFNYNNRITNVVISENITNIGQQAFYNCENLVSVSMPSTLTNIGDNAFDSCSSLTGVTIPESVSSIGSGAFASCNNLGSIVIPTNVTAIADNTFYQSGLTSVSIPASVTSIGNYVFDGCPSLANITIPGSVTNIGTYSFLAGGLTNIAVDTTNPAFSSFGGVLFNKNQTEIIEYPPGLAGSYAIPTSVTDLTFHAFSYCYNPASLTLPNSISNIPAGAFEYAYGIMSVNLPNTITNIGQLAFASSGLTNVAIPNGVVTVGQEAFSSCHHLAGVTIPASLTNLANFVFYASENLLTISVDAGNPAYRSFDGALFNKAQTILLQYPPGDPAATYTVPGTVTSIGADAFATSGNLANVFIPVGVTNVGSGAFFYCLNLTNVYFEGNAPAAPATSFDEDTATVYYLAGTAGWSNSFGGMASAPWPLPYPLILGAANGGAGFGIQSNQFGFTVSWATNLSAIVEACTNLARPVWLPLTTNMLTNGAFYFSDSQWTNYRGRYYRVSEP